MPDQLVLISLDSVLVASHEVVPSVDSVVQPLNVVGEVGDLLDKGRGRRWHTFCEALD